MAVNYTTTELLESIKLRAMIPDADGAFENSGLLQFATEEIMTALMPQLMSEREEYYLTEVGAFQPIVRHKSDYTIPYRAIGMSTRDVIYVDSGGNTRSLSWTDYARVQERNATPNRVPDQFYMKNNKVVLVPTPNESTGQLKLPYFIRPSALVEVNQCAQILAIDYNTNTVTTTTLPPSFSLTSELDFIRRRPGFDCLAIDQIPISITESTLIFAELPDEISVGDWIAPSGQTPIPQIPAELHPILVQRVVLRVMDAQNDKEGAKAATAALEKMEKNARLITTPRVHGETRKVVRKTWWR